MTEISADSGVGCTGDARELSQEVWRLSFSLDALASQVRRQLGLNAHEGLAVTYLWSLGPMTMSELGDRIPLSRAAVTSLVDRLEESGYVRRTADEHDRRRTVLSITSRPAKDVPLAMLQPFRGEIDAILQRLDAGEVQTIRSFLTSVATAALACSDTMRADRVMAELAPGVNGIA